jgi:hypothetical protein
MYAFAAPSWSFIVKSSPLFKLWRHCTAFHAARLVRRCDISCPRLLKLFALDELYREIAGNAKGYRHRGWSGYLVKIGAGRSAAYGKTDRRG